MLLEAARKLAGRVPEAVSIVCVFTFANQVDVAVGIMAAYDRMRPVVCAVEHDQYNIHCMHAIPQRCLVIRSSVDSCQSGCVIVHVLQRQAEEGCKCWPQILIVYDIGMQIHCQPLLPVLLLRYILQNLG